MPLLARFTSGVIAAALAVTLATALPAFGVTGVSGTSGNSSSTTSTSSSTTTTSPCPQTPVATLRSLPQTTRQVILVTAASLSVNHGVLTPYARVGSCWIRLFRGVPAELGYSGMSLHKHEADGKTPEGIFALGTTIYGTGARVSAVFRYHHLVCGDWWDEQSSTPQYNEFVHVGCGIEPPFGGDSEPLWAIQPEYSHFFVIDYNTSPIRKGLGSAIFLHVSVGAPTAGCVAVSASALTQLMTWLNPTDHPRIVMSTTGSLSQW